MKNTKFKIKKSLKPINCEAIAHCSHTARSEATGLITCKLKADRGFTPTPDGAHSKFRSLKATSAPLVWGFTLVEFLIYIAILATILVVTTGFLWLIVLGNIKETAYQEVQQNGRFAMAKMSQEIKKTTGINSPLPGNSANSLSLSMADPKLNPTVFDVVDGKLRITQGTNPSNFLTSDRVIVSSLKFTNLSYSETPGTIQIEMQIDHINPGNRMEYQASVNLTSSVALVPGGAAVPPHLAQLHYRWRNDNGGE